MVDYAQARRTMVDCQVRPSDVTDLRIIAALLDVPRERFVPGGAAPDRLSRPRCSGRTRHGRARCSSRWCFPSSSRRPRSPRTITCSMSAAPRDIRPRCSQNSPAASWRWRKIPHCAAARPRIWPRRRPLSRSRAGRLRPDGRRARPTTRSSSRAARGRAGALFAQLKDGGRLVAVVGSGPMGKATIYRKAVGRLSAQTLFDAAAPLLPGFAKPAAFVF